MCMYGALCSIFFYLICNMTSFGTNVLICNPTLGVEGVCKDRICACMVLYAQFSII